MVDFIFYTDCPIPEKVYPNTIFHAMTLEQYCKKVSETLGIEYAISDCYKLTDLKPFLGLVHQDELKDYQFWSFGDLDLCYGDLGMIVNEKNLGRYDVLTSHNYHIAGHFTVVRNNDCWRSLCLKIRDWQHRLCDDTHYGFDEAEWSWQVYPHLGYVRAVWNRLLKYFKVGLFPWLEFANRLVNPHQLFSEFYTSPAPKSGEEWIYYPGENKLIDPKGRELPYLHFLFFKKTPWLDTDKYWREGYYHLDRPISEYRRIVFNDQGVYGDLKNQ
jgi:hypothetical protein